MSPAPSEFAPLRAIKLVAGGEPITPRMALPEGAHVVSVRAPRDGEVLNPAHIRDVESGRGKGE